MELPSTETAQVDTQSEEWFASYAEPSNRPSSRHRAFRHRRRLDPRRQRLQRLNTLMMVASVVSLNQLSKSIGRSA